MERNDKVERKGKSCEKHKTVEINWDQLIKIYKEFPSIQRPSIKINLRNELE